MCGVLAEALVAFHRSRFAVATARGHFGRWPVSKRRCAITGTPPRCWRSSVLSLLSSFFETALFGGIADASRTLGDRRGKSNTESYDDFLGDRRCDSVRLKLSPTVYAVVATKIRTSRSEAEAGSPAGRVYEGYMLTEPAIGRAMVLFRDLHGRRMITSPVRRVLRTEERQVFYIETENSVYRLRMEECLRGHQDQSGARSLTESARVHRG